MIVNRNKANRTVYFAVTLMILFSLLIFGRTTVSAAPEDQKVYDNYGLFTEEEVASLEDSCREYGEKGKVDIVIITTDGLDGKSRETYLEDLYDEYGFGYEKEYGTTALILINMDSSDRGFEIQGYGEAETYIDDDRTNHMIDDIRPMLSDGKYYKAMIKFAEETSYYMNQPDFDKYYLDTDSIIFFNIFFQLAVALGIGAIAVGIMAIQSGGRITVNNHTYLDEQNSGIIGRRDDYIRTTMTKVRKPSNNSGGSSGGGSGVSSGGHSHSGGGSSF